MRRLATAALLLLGAWGCGAPDAESAPAPESSAPAAPGTTEAPASGRPNTPAASAAPAAPDTPPQHTVNVTVTRLDGTPLPGVGALAAPSPNAFEEPVARSNLTNNQGRAAMRVPADADLYVRGWDPDMRYFANNYYRLTPRAPETFDFALTMVEGGTLEGVFFGPDGRPLAHAGLRMVMVHPSEGAWWPARATTDAEGAAVFAPVPAGEYLLRINAAGGLQGEVAQVALPPGSTRSLGEVLLH